MDKSPHEWMTPTFVPILQVRPESSDTFSIELESEHFPSPGQFNMLYVFGVGEVPISVSRAKASRYIHTIRSVGAVTQALRKLKTGDLVGVRGPFGRGWPIEKAKGRDLLILAGGIGLAPLRPILDEAARNIEQFKNVTLLYGARKPSDCLFKEDWENWERAGINILATVDATETNWNRSVGVVTKLIPKVKFDPANAISFVCGPEIMMLFCVEALNNQGMEEHNIYLSMERNMKCAVGYCGHCQFGVDFICKQGPVFPYPALKSRLKVREI
ncbi:MAG: FAD/NAD(P)-binding protein [Bdellovibrionales bacterium]|nr:FAD/NAD(P)-binding protein [Bdellovibrionales bacterium]